MYIALEASYKMRNSVGSMYKAARTRAKLAGKVQHDGDPA